MPHHRRHPGPSALLRARSRAYPFVVSHRPRRFGRRTRNATKPGRRHRRSHNAVRAWSHAPPRSNGFSCSRFGGTMLKEAHAVLPASDLNRARAYYHDMLGFDPSEEHEGMLMYRPMSDTAFDVYETPNAGTAKNTQMCFGTD